MGILSKRDELRMKPEAFLIAIFHLFSFNLFKPTNLWVFFFLNNALVLVDLHH